MKQFFLKNIVLTVVIFITLVAAGYLGYLIFQKSATIDSAVEEIRGMREKVESINSTHRPNNVAESETLINSDIEFFDNKTMQVYRHFGNPYRSALLAFITNIASKGELAAIEDDAQKDAAFTVAKPAVKEDDAEDADEDAEEKEVETPEEPSKEELEIFNPKTNLVIIKLDESKMRDILAEVYKEIHVDVSNDSDDFIIPDNILDERYAIFAAFIQKIIEPPEFVDAARAEAFKQAAVEKIARAFEIFRKEVDETTLENVDNNVAKQLFLDALGIPRLVRRLDSKNYMDGMYRIYQEENVIPGFKNASDEEIAFGDDYDNRVSQFIYSRLNKQVAPVADMVIPIFRNFQIKEDLVRRMNEAHIRKVVSITPKYIPGNTLDGDPDSAILVYNYTIELQSALDEVSHFIDSLHTAYKDNRVYVITNLKFEAKDSDVSDANWLVGTHIASEKEDAEKAAEESAEAAAGDGKNVDPEAVLRAMYKIDDPKHIDYGEVVLGNKRGDVKCTLTVDYYLFRGDNIIPDK